MSTDQIRTQAADVFAQHIGQHLLIYFVKRNGELRRMTCVYNGASAKGRQATALPVWDTQKGAGRSVYLPGVRRIKVLATRRHEPTSADLRAELEAYFY